MPAALGEGFQESWQITKPAVHANGGIVTSQHYLASQAGAKVLEDGGNAVDAAVTTALYLGTVEPWMSGIGGGGVMMVYLAAEDRTYAVDFTMVAPRDLNPSDYPLSEGDGGDLFGWPAVRENVNVYGPLSCAVPGNVAGLSMALERFGTRSFKDAIAPAVEQAKTGMPVDWYGTLKIASGGPILAQYPESARTYLPNGHVPCGEWGGPPPSIRLGQLASTLEQLGHAGPRDFYHGEIAAQIESDMIDAGGYIKRHDLSAYKARIFDVPPTPYRDHHVYAAPGLTAGPTLCDALSKLETRLVSTGHPDTQTYLAYAGCLNEAYETRLKTMGDADEQRAPSCTTHLSVADAHGNVVALTQTLLSIFGSKVMLPSTGILWNNGIMWFDPRPGRPNSMVPGKRPLSNMCPTIVARSDGAKFGLGASGGRRIFPAVFQLSSFLMDFEMDLDGAFHTPRIDLSATAQVSVDRKLPQSTKDAMADEFDGVPETHGVFPALYACPNSAAALPDGTQCGAAFITSPWSKAVAAEK